MSTDNTTITQELDAIIRASAKAAKALEELEAAYEVHAKRGKSALHFMGDAIQGSRGSRREIESIAADAKKYKVQLMS